MVVKIINAGFSINCPPNQPPTINVPKKLEDDDWGFNASAMKKAAEEINHTDRQLLSIFDWGAPDYSEQTPPVCVFVGPDPSALHQVETVDDHLDEEVENKYMVKVGRQPTTVPFHALPCGLVTKRYSVK